MKKILLSGLALSLSILAQAQTGKWFFGAQASLGLSTVSNVYDSRLNSPSFGVGLQTLYKLDDHWQLGASLQLSRDGYEGSTVYNPSLYFPGFTEEYTLNFTQKESVSMLRLPLQIRYNFLSPAKKIRPYTYLGGSIGYRMSDNSAEFIGHDDPTKDFFSTMDAMYPQYNRLDYGVMIGTGLSFRIKQGPVINAELYYYQGLKDQSQIISFEMANRANPSKQLQQQLRLQISIIDLL